MHVSQRSSLLLGVSSANVLSAWFQVTVELARLYTSVDCTAAADARMAAAKKMIFDMMEEAVGEKRCCPLWSLVRLA